MSAPKKSPRHSNQRVKAAETQKRRLAILFRCLAGLWVILAIALSFPDPGDRLRLPDPWAYRFAAENFAQGRWVVNDDQAAAGRMAARLQGGHLTQYVNVGTDRWALEKAPGFPLLAVPLQWLGIPQFTNTGLAIAAAIALYVLVALWYGEGLACAAVALFMLTPMSLVAHNNTWMDTFASGALPLLGGAFYFLYLLRPTHRGALALAFVAGLGLGWAGVVRLSNVMILGLCGLHLLVTAWQAQPRKPRVYAPIAFGLGGAFALGALALYNLAVFGRVFDAGYNYSLYRMSFAVGGAVGKPGVPVPEINLLSGLLLVGHNFARAIPAWLIGFPMLLAAIPGWVVAEHQRTGRLSRWLLALWALVVALPYIAFTWLDTLLAQFAEYYELFVEIDRYFFPWVFPLTILAVAGLARLPRWAAWSLTALCLAGSIWLYLQLGTGA